MDNYEDLGAIPVQQNDYSDLGAIPVVASPSVAQDPNAGYGDPNMSWGSRFVRDDLAGMGELGHQLLNAPHNLVNMVSPNAASYIPTQQDYNFAQMTGAPNQLADQFIRGAARNSLSMVAPEMPLGQAGNAIRLIPKVGNFTANALGRIIPQAGVGLVTSDNPLQGAAEYGGMQGAIEGAVPIAKALWSPIAAMQPQKFAKNILNSLGNGMSIPDSARTFAQKIKGAYENAQAAGGKLYGSTTGDPILNSDHIYNDEMTPETAQYLNLNPKVTSNYTPDLKNLDESFNENPSLGNAHDLQSELGKEVRRLQGMEQAKNLDTSGRADLQNYSNARNSLLSDIHNHLDDISPGLSDEYKTATENYAKTVGPYHTGDLSNISTGKVTHPENISNTFKTENNDLLNSVVKDVGPSANNHIIYDQLGNIKNMTPEKLLDKFNSLQNTGYNKYITQDMHDSFDKLSTMINFRNGMQKLASGAAGYKIGSSLFGHPGAELGSLAAGYAGHGIANALSYFLPSGRLGGAIANTLSRAYQPAAKAAGVNYLNLPQGSRQNDNQLQPTP